MWPCMKLRHIEEFLQEIDGFEKPKVTLEQYPTPSHLASHMLHTIQARYDDFDSKIVADLGCGCGSLTLGAAVLNANLVVGFEIDSDALDIFCSNVDTQELENVQVIQCDVLTSISDRWNKMFDTVIMNPPFGTKCNAGIDMKFLKRALKLSNNVVYSLHKTSTRAHVLKTASECGAKGTVLAELSFFANTSISSSNNCRFARITRIRKLIKCLIPKRYVPDAAVQNVILWLMQNYTKMHSPLIFKLILQWLIGLIEFDLITTKKIINIYYDSYYYFLQYEVVDIPASKLIYLLTKREDVNRWYVKQVMRIHEKKCRPKYTGSLLYLFKSYRPDCVPENIPAYAAHKAFGSLPNIIISGFISVQDRIKRDDMIPKTIDDNIDWFQFDLRPQQVKKNNITLIPSIAQNEANMNFALDGFKSLFSISNVKKLHKYHLSSTSPNCVMSLLKNSAGFYILAFGDQTIQERFSFQLYYLLCDTFIQRNPQVSFAEKDNLLRKISILQMNMQQSIPVVSKFIALFLPRWDGVEHEEHIYNLMEWLHLQSYKELHDCILNYLYDIFMSGSLNTKCNILQFLANLAVNIIHTHFYKTRNEISSLFLDLKVVWQFEEIIPKLYVYIKKLCSLGLYLENRHNLVMYSVFQVHEKIMAAEESAGIAMWDISPYLTYAALFSCSPNSLMKICGLLNRYPRYMSETVKLDFLNSLWYNKAFLPVDECSIFYGFNEEKLKFLDQSINVNQCLNWENHFALSCYNNLWEGNETDESDTGFNEFLKYTQNNFKDIFDFLRNYV